MKLFPLLSLLAIFPLAAEPMLSEFMASNEDSLKDGNDESNDWIEIHNPEAGPVNLAGWRLRDSDSEWIFPDTTLAGGGYLVVFASGRDEADYVDPAGFFHTTFKLSSSGESLSLLRPDGSVAGEFSNVPSQRTDVSFGVFEERNDLILPDSTARYFVGETAVDDAWRSDPGFDDSGWKSGAAALGFGRENGEEIFTAYQVPAGVNGNQNANFSLGMDFIVIEPVLITELGVFDSGSDGISNSLTAQLWQRDDRGTPGNFDDDRGQQMLASAQFTRAEPGELDGGSRFKTLPTPVTLEPGAYTISVSGFSLADRNGNLGIPDAADWETDDADGTLQFTGRARYGALRAFPTTLDGGPANRYAAGTFKLLPLKSSEVLNDIGAQMRDVSDRVRERIAFEISDPAVVSSLVLQIAYDDGFSAWINGTQVAAQNFPVTEAERGVRSFTLMLPEGVLNSGTNILAIEGRNLSAEDPDFLLRPRLFSKLADSAEDRFFEEPTPGAPNSTTSFLGFVADTKFSVDRGFFTEAFEVEITSATEAATIVFTTDGSEPSLENGETYSAPITINSTTVLRARAFLEGFRATDIDTQSYLFAAGIARQSNSPPGYPISWSGTSPNYGMTPAASSYARAAGDPGFTPAEAQAAIEDSLAALPSLSVVTNTDNLFDSVTGIYVNPVARGQAWERPVSVELIHPDGSPGFQEDAGMRMMGFSSRNIEVRKLHMRLLFKKNYGAGRLDYPFFGKDHAGRINTIALRGNRRDAFIHTNNATYLGDEWAKRTQSEMGQPAVAGTFVHLYLNGLYWGVYNPTERPDDAFAESYFGGDREDYDVVKFCCPDRAVSGSIDHWNELLGEARGGIDTLADYYRVQGLAANGTPDPEIPALLDVDNFIDYLIAGHFPGAWDWPGNFYAIRDRRDDRTTGYQFYTWDNDVIFDGGNPTVSNKVAPDPGHPWWTESPGEVDIGIRDNPEYRMRFADRVYLHYFHGGALSEEKNLARWNDLAAIVRPALFAESARWGDANSPLRTVQNHWDPMNSRMVNQYFPRRQEIVFDQMRASGLYPSIDPPEFNRRGGTVAKGFGLAFTSGRNIYYTNDGSDPRLPGGGINPAAIKAASGLSLVTLADETGPVRAIIPADGALGTDWTAVNFDDSSWQVGTSGVGYDNGNGYSGIIGLDVFDTMRGANETAYLRKDFDGASPEDLVSLTLKMRFDDGFVAYLNGVKIAAANEPVEPVWNSGAIRSTEASTTEFVDFEISEFINLLRPDGNVLAIHGMNRGAASSDFVIQARLVGDSVSGQIAAVLNETVEIKARSLEGGEWSALNEASFIVGTPATSENLVISEVFYNPPGPEEADEFIELFNPSATAVDLSGVRFSDGITYDFPLGSELAAGNRLVLSPADYQGNLANSGETITLLAGDGSVIASFRYGDDFPWPSSADGDGSSLVFLGPDPKDPRSWRQSTTLGATPGDDDSLRFGGGDLLAYALPAPRPRFVSNGGEWSFEFTRPLAADDARYVVEISGDLQNWAAAGSRTALTISDEFGNVIETVSGRLPVESARQFARVRVILRE